MARLTKKTNGKNGNKTSSKAAKGCFGSKKRYGSKAAWKLQKRHDKETMRKARIKMNRGKAL